MADQIAHVVFFTLKDKSPERQQSLIEACNKYLKPQPGVLSFSSGVREADLQREVNDTEFDVSLMLVFESREAHDRYQADAAHDAFIAEQKENWAQVRVFDSRL
jgi:hypothetical protein